MTHRFYSRVKYWGNQHWCETHQGEIIFLLHETTQRSLTRDQTKFTLELNLTYNIPLSSAVGFIGTARGKRRGYILPLFSVHQKLELFLNFAPPKARVFLLFLLYLCQQPSVCLPEFLVLVRPYLDRGCTSSDFSFKVSEILCCQLSQTSTPKGSNKLNHKIDLHQKKPF